MKDRSQLGYSHWNWKTLPVELVAGAAVSVDRSLKSSEACVLAFGPAEKRLEGVATPEAGSPRFQIAPRYWRAPPGGKNHGLPRARAIPRLARLFPPFP